MVIVAVGLLALLVWSQEYALKRRKLKIFVWTGAIFLILLWIFFSDSLATAGPASWVDVYDGVMPEGYSRHSVETWVSADENWIVGETKECKSYPLIPVGARYFGREPGDASGSFLCGDGPKHRVSVNFYGRLNQPEHKTAYWDCTRNPESFTCRQTGAE